MERRSEHPFHAHGVWQGKGCAQDYHAGSFQNSLSPKQDFKVLIPWVDRAAVSCSAVQDLADQSPEIFPLHAPGTSMSCARGCLLSVGPQYLWLAQQERLPHDTATNY